ncbi:hypothetical protein F4859DRAFT_522798 [Xylaria cf. heliscus]|nr:hypothetical protein F4859DRAFT_522798 [Xylaria cf. heliscus]
MYSTAPLLGLTTLIWITSISFAPVVVGQSVGQFFSPPPYGSTTDDNSANPVYALGDTQTIKFTTTYSDYAINLCQVNWGDGTSTLGPSVFSTENGAVTQFDWLVQVYQFDLSASNVFYLWLTSKIQNDDGSDPEAIASQYFNISDDSYFNDPDPSDSSSSAPLTSTISFTEPSTTSLSPTGTTTYPPTITPSQTLVPGGLNTGAKAGIGVGASLAGLAVITLSLLLFRRIRQRRGYQAPDQPQAPEAVAHEEISVVRDASFQGFKTPTGAVELGH